MKLKGKKIMKRQYEHRLVSWQEYGDIAWLYRGRVSKAKLNLARDIKNNKKSFCRYVSH